METLVDTLHTLFILLVLGTIFIGIPGGLLVLMLKMKANQRRALLEGPWGALAQHFGGRVEGERVVVSRDVYQMSLGMELVSVLQAASNVYYPDGGTYTEARLMLDPRSALRVATLDRPVRTSARNIPLLMPESPLAQLPPDTRVVFGPHEARVVFNGVVGDASAIHAAFAGLQALAERVRAIGPLEVNL